MDRRLTSWACAAALAAGVGCKTDKTQVAADAPGGGANQSMLGKAFGSKLPPPGTPGMPPVTAARPPRKPGEGLKPETEVGLAAVDYDVAMAAGSTVERDQLLDAARQKYGRALKTDPKNKDALVGLARLYTATGDKDHAVAALTTAVQYHPADHKLSYRLAATQFKFGDFPAAAQACEAALKGDPGSREYHKTLALCQAHQNQWDQAFASLVRSSTMSQAEARYFLGRVLVDVGRPEDGRAQIAEAAKIDPNYTLAAQTLADLDANGGKLPETVPAPAAGVVNVEYQQPQP